MAEAAQAIPSLFEHADPNDLNDEIPHCFIKGTTSLTEARSRWQKTKKWRAAHSVDGILSRPHAHYDIIKQNYPHALHKIGEKGMYIYIERPGFAKLADCWSRGLTMDDIEYHYTFTTEYLWRVLQPSAEAQLVSVFDVDNCSMSDLAGDTFSMFKRCSEVIGQHYPERAHKIFIINSPTWMSWVWSTISPFLDPVTVKKISILKKGKDHIAQIVEFCSVEKLPKEIGGADETPLGQSEAELQMAAHAHKLNDVTPQ